MKNGNYSSILFFCFFLLLSFSLTTCTKDIAVHEEPVLAEFQKTIGGSNAEIGYAIIEASDNNYVIAGITKTYGSGSEDIYLVKTNPSGKILWEKTFGGAGRDIAYDVIETPDGGYLIAGTTKSFTLAVGYDAYLVRTDKDGNLLWQKTYGNNNNDCAYSIAALSDNSGYVLVGGTGGVIVYFTGDVYVIKVNQYGDTIFTKTFNSPSPDEGISVTADVQGNFYLLNRIYDDGTGKKGMLAMKMSSSGDSLWSMVIDGPEWEEGQYIRVTNDGGLIICGSTASYGDLNGDLFAVKISPGGIVSWQKNFGGMAFDEAQAVIQTQDGGYLFAGSSKSYTNESEDMFLVKTDAFGIAQWYKIIGGTYQDGANAIAETNDAYIIAGYTYQTALSNSDIFLVKIKKQ